MRVKLDTVVGVFFKDSPFDDRFVEFPWKAQYKRLREIYTRTMLSILNEEDQVVGGMVLDYSEETPSLIFFEVVREHRGKGYGKEALDLLVDLLRAKGHERLFVQTGRRQIYTALDYKFEPAPGGLYLDLRFPWAHAAPGEAPLSLVYHPDYLIYNLPKHPETPQRISHTLILLHTSKMLKTLGHLFPREATREELLLVHTPKHVRKIEEASIRGEALDQTTIAYEGTFRVASLAYGGALTAAERVEALRRVFVLARPPGHHAGPEEAKGFCFFNNVAGAAEYLRRRGYRVAILDWDAHHGDGTQRIFWDKPVLYVSVHQKYAYPYTGYPDERGEGMGLGYTVNLPVPPESDYNVYKGAFLRALESIRRFSPDVILVSAGFDAHRADPLSSLRLESESFYEMGRLVRELADDVAEGRLILVLEGGYNSVAVAESVAATIRGILGEDGTWRR